MLRRWNQKPIKQGRPVAHSLPLVLPAFGQAAPFHCLITKAEVSSVTSELLDLQKPPAFGQAAPLLAITKAKA